MKSSGKAVFSLSLCALVVLLSGILWTKPGVTVAQGGVGKLEVSTTILSASYAALRENSVMLSVIKDGEVIKQTERPMNAHAGFELPTGLYDLRAEGDGMVTLVKRGIHVKAGERTDVIAGPMRAGAGARIIEYAATGMTREEMAARIGKLEAAVAELQKTRQTK